MSLYTYVCVYLYLYMYVCEYIWVMIIDLSTTSHIV